MEYPWILSPDTPAFSTRTSEASDSEPLPPDSENGDMTDLATEVEGTDIDEYVPSLLLRDVRWRVAQYRLRYRNRGRHNQGQLYQEPFPPMPVNWGLRPLSPLMEELD